MGNDLGQNDNANRASLGQNGIRQLATGATSVTDEKFVAIYANADSAFTVADGGGGATSITVALIKGGSIPGKFSNITSLTGNILCFKSE
jgi:hypothetical protein